MAQTGFSQKSGFLDLALMARRGSRVPITPAIDTSLNDRSLSAVKIRLQKNLTSAGH
jgi:hypothetical protein